MSRKDDDFRKRLFSTFMIEAQEHLNAISSEMVEMENTQSPETEMEILETVYRECHSLKGAARAVDMTDVETVCQTLEGVFDAWKKKRISRSPGLFENIHYAVDVVRTILNSHEAGQPVPDKVNVSMLIEELSHLETGGPAGRTRPDEGLSYRRLRQHKERPVRSDTVRISAARLGSLLLEAEEMLTVKLTADQQFSSLKDVTDMVGLLKNRSSKIYLDEQTAQRKIERRDGGNKKASTAFMPVKQQEFLDWLQTHTTSIEGRLAALIKSTRKYNRSFERMVDNLLDDMKKAMMLPFSTLLESFPMLVRSIAHEQGKDVELEIRGEGIEIDKRILEEMKDPLIHLIRNSIDHGIEKSEVRAANRKPRRSIVTIAISHLNEGGKVEILVSDDGSGIDVAEVKETAVRNGIISQAEADSISNHEALSLIFRSGFSTSPIITDISGRGLGLAIVQEKVEKLNGSMSVESEINKGTTFRILLPLTIATFRGILVRLSDHIFIVPTINVEQVARVRRDEIKTVENKETISLKGCPVSFVMLESVLELPHRKRKDEGQGHITALVLGSAERRIAFGVDEMLGEQEFMVKSLGRQLSRVRNVAGAAIFGTGKPLPVLSVPDLIRSAVKAPAAPVMPVAEAEEAEGERKSVLIVEDSITSRILLKNIIESAGYDVKTAFDGIDAITALKTEDFNLVVSDIEMPRMNGFDLTAKIRGDKKLADLPVVLVTALETREDRERGIDVGANAYIVKSSFNQSNLLEVIKRLI